MNKLSKEQVMQIAEMRNNGDTDEKIGETFGVTRGTVSYWVKRLRDSGHTVNRFKRGGRKAIEL